MQVATNKTETIAAIATASGSGGIGVVRVSGPAAQSIVTEILGHCPKPRFAAYLPFMDADDQLIDRGIAIYYAAPNSYTGEDVLELQAHGGPALLQILLGRCLALGARQAAPGEFTRRAYLNEKMDLAQAEAVADVINAATTEAAKSATRSLSGEFSNRINVLLNRLIELRMYVEACLDFPEEEIDFIKQHDVLGRLEAISKKISEIKQSAQQGSIVRDGITVVLAGQPNVGKSSLLNALAGQEIAIVTSVPGTTRDRLKETILLDGIPLHIIDTAGLRDTLDEVEQIGIERTWDSIEQADVILLLMDAQEGFDVNVSNRELLNQINAKLGQHVPVKLVWNKADLVEKYPPSSNDHFYISAPHYRD